MGILDFLFEGKPPPATTTSSTTSMPQWMHDYTTQLLARANAEATAPYQPYEGPRIAGFNQTQRDAFDLARSNIGSAQPGLNAAMTIGQNLPGQGALQQAMNYLPGSLEEFPDAAGRYMDPYVSNVIDRSTNQALKAWNEQIQPGLEGQFVRAGGYGSSAHARALGKAADQVTQNIQDNANAALSNAWTTSANIFNQDQSRATQNASVLGNLGTSIGNLGLNQAGVLSDIARAIQSAGANDAATLEAIGAQERGLDQSNLDLAYQDFTRQQGHGKEQLGWLMNMLQGSTPMVPQTTNEVGPASAYQPGGLAQIASIISAWRGIQGKGD